MAPSLLVRKRFERKKNITKGESKMDNNKQEVQKDYPLGTSYLSLWTP